MYYSLIVSHVYLNLSGQKYVNEDRNNTLLMPENDYTSIHKKVHKLTFKRNVLVFFIHKKSPTQVPGFFIKVFIY